MLFKKILLSAAAVMGSYLAMAQPSSNINGQDENERPVVTAVPFLTITPDARSAAMGDVGVALSADANASYWNAAKLSFADKPIGASISVTPWLQKLVDDMWITYLTGYYRLPDKVSTVSGSMRYFSLGTMQFTDINGEIITDFTPKEWAFDVSYSRKLSNRFSMAVGGRFIRSNLSGSISNAGNNTTSKPANTIAGDISSYWRNPDLMIQGKKTEIALGLTVTNIGPKISYSNAQNLDFIPTTLRMGGAMTTELDPYNKLTLAFDATKLLVPTPPVRDDSGNIIAGQDPDRGLLAGMFGSFSDAPDGFSEELKEFNMAVGAEYWYNNTLAIRAGYFNEHKLKGFRQYYTLGLGLRYSKVGFDFAYLVASRKDHPLKDTMRFSIMLNLDSISGNDTE